MFLSLVGYGDPGVMGTVDIGLWGSVGSPVHSPQHHTIATINNANIGYILFSDLCGLVPISAHLVPVYKSHMNVLRYDTNLLGCRTSVGCCATVIGRNIWFIFLWGVCRGGGVWVV